jgi:spermidine synthase
MLAAFLGSWLLFTLELLVARLLLPGFGGAAWVWTASLTFFQGVLFVSYFWTNTKPSRSRPMRLALLALPLLGAPFLLSPPPSGSSLGELLAALILLSGAPLFTLGTTSPVLQSSLEAERGRPAWELYAWSNAGALTALLAYPVLLEPLLELKAQVLLWFGLYGVYAAATAAVVRSVPAPPSGKTSASWVLLAIGPSAALAAATNLLMLDFAAVPLVWIVPLALYLLTFILVFKKKPVETKRLGAVVVGAMLLWFFAAAVTTRFSVDIPQAWAFAGKLWALNKFFFVNACLFLLCLVAHRALAARKPEGRAPEYYASLAFGGWLGSAWIGWLMPVLGRNLALPELDWALAGVATIALLIWHAPDRPSFGAGKLAGVALLLAAAGVFYVRSSPAFLALESRRNFYGFYRVTEEDGRRHFFHGNTAHGLELAAQPGEPMLYYHRHSAAADVFTGLPPKARVALLGLGTGAVAAYGKAGQFFDYYELDSDVIELALGWFTHLSRGKAAARFIVGDARLRLEESPELYDLILVDVFAGGAIPVHLMTREALDLYARRLKPGGRVALHVTNRYLELRPVLAAAAREGGWTGLSKTTPRSELRPEELYASTWVALSRAPLKLTGWGPLWEHVGGRAWTDAYAPIWTALR